MSKIKNKKIDTWTTPAGLNKIREWVQAGLTDREIADRVGVHYVTLSNWRRTNDKIRAALYKQDPDSGRDIRDNTRAGRRMAWHIDAIRAAVNEWINERRRQELPLTITSLLIKLHISRETFDRYANDTTGTLTDGIETDITGDSHYIAIADVLKECKRMCESSLVDRCLGKAQCAGAIFILKNHFGYQDVQRVETDKGPVVVKWGADVPATLVSSSADKQGESKQE